MKKRTVKKSKRARAAALPEEGISAHERRRMTAELREAEERVALAALDALSAQIAMLDGDGNILAINKAWRDSAGTTSATDRALPGKNYFDHCRRLPEGMGHFAELVEGVKLILAGKRADFVIEYPCAAPAGEKWFHARVTGCSVPGPVRAVIAHEDISGRVELERDIVTVQEREQQRFRQDLHDGLSQHLTGLKFKASLLEYHLQSKDVPEASEAKALSELLNQATEEASELARRMRPVEVESRGLMMALRELAATVEHTHDIKCTASISRPVFIHDNTVATHLFRIAQEAVNSAAEHGEATTIQIALRESGEHVTLAVRDNGKPLPERPREGLGAHLIRYHARVIGGVLDWRVESQGAVLVCSFRKRAVAR
jgi:hypothetical protein